MAVWVSAAVVFTLLIARLKGMTIAVEFLTCYAIEWTLSLDNLFVFLMIFKSFGVDERSQERALKWGITGAVVMRLGFILAGVALVMLFTPVLYFFGALLLYSAIRMILHRGGSLNVQDNRIIRFAKKHLPLTERYEGNRFFVRQDKRLLFTPLLLVVVAVESSDVMFAIDSIPAALAITHNPSIIFAANLFAILGLRSLYYTLAHADKMFSKLRYGVAAILGFVGIKIIVEQLMDQVFGRKGFHVDMYISLGVVVFCLGGSILLSLIIGRNRMLN